MYRVLIIDDEEIIREGLKITIPWESMGCEVVGEAEDGDEGVTLINTLKPDIVFTDIRMPGLDGLAMISKIKEMKNDCRIIIITGFRDFEYAQTAIKLGAFRFLLKPSNTDEIMQAVGAAIEEIKQSKAKDEMFNNLKKKVKEYYTLKDSDLESPEKNAAPSKPEENGQGESARNSKYLVSKAVSFMKANYSKDLSLKSVADELYISTWHLSKVIKKETGSTFIDLLNEIRINEAKKLLLDPKYKVYEVADSVGFVDVPYFTKLFKKLTGITPMEFKNSSAG